MDLYTPEREKTMLLKLFIEFFQIGLITYGGGLAILVFLQARVIELGWLNAKQFVDVIGIAESTPGPIAINLATFVGFSQSGVLGGIVASTAVIIPGTILTIIVSRFLEHFDEHPVVKSVLKGLKAIVIGLILSATISIIKVTLINIDSFNLTKSIHSLLDYKAIILCGVLTFLIAKQDKNPIYYIFGASIVGLFIF